MNFKVLGHAPFLGHTGYNNHVRNFFTYLNNYIPVRVKNFTTCEDVSYLKQHEHDLLVEQELDAGDVVGKPFNPLPKDKFINIILADSNHPLFYNHYQSPMIAYNVWESTRQIPQFFNRILQYDQFWCPTEWQRQCTIEQGYPADRVKVVHEGVGELFVPGSKDLSIGHRLFEKYNIPAGSFVFMIFGKWEYRKSTTEMVRSWTNVFGNNPDCYLIISADNNFSTDGMTTTEERLKHYNLEHENIRVLHYIPRDEYIKWLQYGSCLLTCSRSEGWNLPLMEALACGTPSICSDWGGQLEFAQDHAYKVRIRNTKQPKQVYAFEDTSQIGVWAEPDFYNLEYIMKYVYDVYPRARLTTTKLSMKLRENFSWDNAAKEAKKNIDELLIQKNFYYRKKGVDYNIHFIDGPFVEIVGDSPSKFLINFIDIKSPPLLVHQQSLLCNRWSRPTKKYYKDWFITIHEDNNLVKTHMFNLNNQNVLISFDSKSLGDSIAWMPIVEKFRIKHSCKIYLSTFYNHLFENSYPEIEFIKPGSVIENIYASYSVGCYDNDYSRNKNNWRSIPLQKVCSDMLGIDYEETICKLGVEIGTRPVKERYVSISEFTTFKGKHWNYLNGWQEVCDYLNSIGYKVISVSQEKSLLENVVKQNCKSLEETITNIYHSDFFIGVSSGPSWLSWALEKPTILISGFTEEWVEFKNKCSRIINKNVCNGCFNDLSLKIDRGDWDWCPKNNNYICTKKIEPSMVIEEINKIVESKGLLS